MDDLISRKAAIDAVHKNYDVILDFTSDGQTISSSIEDILSDLPSAQPDLSEYSDNLWKAAYERGRAEALAEIVRCKDCKYYHDSDGCFFSTVDTEDDDYCSFAERRTDG